MTFKMIQFSAKYKIVLSRLKSPLRTSSLLSGLSELKMLRVALFTERGRCWEYFFRLQMIRLLCFAWRIILFWRPRRFELFAECLIFLSAKIKEIRWRQRGGHFKWILMTQLIVAWWPGGAPRHSGVKNSRTTEPRGRWLKPHKHFQKQIKRPQFKHV